MKLQQSTGWLASKLDLVKSEEDMIRIGYECRGRLCEFEGYEDFSERLWVCVIPDYDKKIYNTAIILDEGNSNCTVYYRDFYIKGLFEEEK